ncbi:pterin-4-alpha-carbinolamine dehydratase 2, mitochondrial-like [Bidens hawaiensis]|uniref:pterin-4-alpha-carbinolamine dehydratase 2, mitochondrial-like n=1 Tax=Bidens hawaiensis TaxID=980011 RepID=UPI00404B028B
MDSGGHFVPPKVYLPLQKCVPCNRKDLSPMTEESANVLKPKIPEWELLNDGGVMKLRREWKVKNFLLGLEFFKIVADLAESEGHHPDLHLVGWNNVTIEIWTHACGGLTENDFILAAKIDKLPFESYLRRSK